MPGVEGIQLFKRIEQAVAGKTREEFFRHLVRALAEALGAYAAFAGKLNPDHTATMTAYWVDGEFRPCTTYRLDGTPCEFVYAGRISSYSRDIGEVFPIDREWFLSLGVNSYLGVPCTDENGEVFGHIAVMDTAERDWHEADVDILQLFSLRAAAELERMRYEHRLEQANADLQAEIERREAVEKELTAARLLAESANQAKSRFINNMSHELRTPLNGILGYAQFMKRDRRTLAKAHLEGLEVIEHSGQHLLALIDDLLDLAKIESGKLHVASAPIDLGSLLDDVCELTAVRARDASIDFRFATSPVRGRTVLGDERALRQVFLNLLGNAVKFTPAGGIVELDVECRTPMRGRCGLTVRLRDSGVGIPPGDLERVFEPFFQVADPRCSTEGTGLGLAITRSLTEAMHGSIQVSSEPGIGSVFVTEFEFDEVSAPAPVRTIVAPVSGYEGPTRRVLVVDHDAVNRTLLISLLTDVGFFVDAAADDAQALELAHRSPPDLVIADIGRSVVDAGEFVRAVRAHGSHARLPALAISATAHRDAERDTLAAGYDAFVAKPIQFAPLCDAIGRLIGIEWTFADGEFPNSHLDPDLARNLNDCARRGDILALNALIESALARDPERQALYATLRSLAARYDMAGVRQVLSSLATATTA